MTEEWKCGCLFAGDPCIKMDWLSKKLNRKGFREYKRMQNG